MMRYLDKSRRLGLSLVVLMLLASCGRSSLNAPQIPSYDPAQSGAYLPDNNVHGYNPYEPRNPSDKTYAILKNVFLRVDPEIGITITDLEGELEPKRAGDPVIFDDVRSFIFHVYRSRKIIDGPNITRLMNKYVFNYPEAPLKDLEVSFKPGRIIMKGKMKQVFWVPFEMEGVPFATPEGNIQMNPDKITTLGIPAKGLMDLLGLKTSKLIKLSEERGVKMEGNAVIMYPTRMFPPPTITGKVVSVHVDENAFTMIFDNGQRVPQRRPPDPNVRNYKYIWGPRVLIMNELHRNAELQMVDMDQSDPFDFFLEKYNEHLRAGYVKVMNQQGTLVTLMPDYSEINKVDVWDQYPGQPPRRNIYDSTPGNPGYPGYGNNTYQAQGYMPARRYWNR